MMKRGFTLLELLVVIGIMGILGTVSVGGYRAMQRGMEERGVKSNVTEFLRAAYQRAQIDRQPVTVYLWNELLREETDAENKIVVGKAVAVRRSSRITYAVPPYLGDEFGDLRFNSLVTTGGDEDTESSTGAGTGVLLYKLNGNETTREMSVVAKSTIKRSLREKLLCGKTGALSGDAAVFADIDLDEADIEFYAFRILSDGGATWKVGDAYGFEFANIELPHNYMFGATIPDSMSNPESEPMVIRFEVKSNPDDTNFTSGTGSAAAIYSLRPGASGSLEPQLVQ